MIVAAIGTVALIIGVLLAWRRVRRTHEIGQNPLLRKKEICLATSRSEAVDLVAAAIRGSGGSILSEDTDKGQVVAKYGMTRKTWAQYLQVDLWATDRGEQQAVCTSWPTQDSVITEWGAGNIVIDHVIDKLNELGTPGMIVGSTTAGHTIH